MPTFVAERYLPATPPAELSAVGEDARRAAREMTAMGIPVRVIHAVHVPTDETCFTLFEAPSADALAEAHRRAGIPFDRIVAAVEIASDPDREGRLG
jgi:Nickel responsive protein SCO4226-like